MAEVYPQDLSVNIYRQVMQQRRERGSLGAAELKLDINQMCDFLREWRALPQINRARRQYVPSLTKVFQKKKAIRNSPLLFLPIIGFILFRSPPFLSNPFHIPMPSDFGTAVLAAVFGCGLWYAISILLMVSPIGLLLDFHSPTLLKTCHLPLADKEKDMLLGTLPHVAKGYWTLCATIAEKKPYLSPEAYRNVQEAFDAVSDAVERLLAGAIGMDIAPSQELLDRADKLEKEAGGEADTVVASSLRRQAEALRTSISISDRMRVISRRHETLEREIAAQIEAMRISLAHYHQGAQDSGEEFRSVARYIQQVASEAEANAVAIDELQAILSPTYDLPNTQSLRT